MTFAIVLIVFSGTAYMALYPKLPEVFFELYVLNKNKLAEDYYPEPGKWNVPKGFQIDWFIGVSNFMGSSQLVLLKIKLGSSTTGLPDENKPTPADLPTIFEFRRVLLSGEKFEDLISWKIVDTQIRNGLSYVTLNINGTVAQVDSIGASNGENFRFVIELWRYDLNSDQYTFGWKSGQETRVAWLQIWFTVK